MWLEIQARQNFGTVNKPKLGVLLYQEGEGSIYQPPDGALLRDQTGREFRVRRLAEYGVWVGLNPLDGDPSGPSKDRIEQIDN